MLYIPVGRDFCARAMQETMFASFRGDPTLDHLLLPVRGVLLRWMRSTGSFFLAMSATDTSSPNQLEGFLSHGEIGTFCLLTLVKMATLIVVEPGRSIRVCVAAEGRLGPRFVDFESYAHHQSLKVLGCVGEIHLM